MAKKRYIYLIPAAAALVLELLPFGAVLVFQPSPDRESRRRELCSYFDLLPFGYANFGPLLTAICTCALLVFLLISLAKPAAKGAAFGFSLVAAAFSLMPLMLGIEFYSPVGMLITLALIAECVLLKVLK